MLSINTLPSSAALPGLALTPSLDRLTLRSTACCASRLLAPLSARSVCGCLWFVLHQWRGNTYLGEAKYMLAALGDADGEYMQIFSIFLGTALLTLPVLSYAESQLGPTGQMQLVSVLALAHALCALVPSLSWQLGAPLAAACRSVTRRPPCEHACRVLIADLTLTASSLVACVRALALAPALAPALSLSLAVTFTIFTLLRTSIYSTAGIFVASTFGFGRMGLVYGLMQFAGALSNLTIAPVASWILDDSGLDGDWKPLLYLWIALAIGQFAMIDWLARRP